MDNLHLVLFIFLLPPMLCGILCFYWKRNQHPISKRNPYLSLFTQIILLSYPITMFIAYQIDFSCAINNELLLFTYVSYIPIFILRLWKLFIHQRFFRASLKSSDSIQPPSTQYISNNNWGLRHVYLNSWKVDILIIICCFLFFLIPLVCFLFFYEGSVKNSCVLNIS